MYIKAATASAINVTVARLRCPYCRLKGTFDSCGVPDIGLAESGSNFLFSAGIRRCPNVDCFGIVFVFLDVPAQKVLESLPAERIDFDASNIPANILCAFKEAIICHSAGCYNASAIMIRKTLEELCYDRKAMGKNLHLRLIALGKQIVLPSELTTGLMDLKYLGNDAAHIEVKTYNKIGKEEVEIGIEVTKALLNAVYQVAGIVGRLAALKRQKADEADEEPDD